MTDYMINGEILKKRKLITLDGLKVTTETGIPLARNIVLPGVQSDGSDVRLAHLDGTPIAREIECVGVPSTDAVMFHYPFNTVAGENSQFYVYWGNASLNEPAADSTYGSEAVWDSNYVAVWHMSNDPSGSAPQLQDSTSNDNNGTSEGGMTSGDLVNSAYGKETRFDTNDGYSCGDSNELDGMGAITIESKVHFNSLSSPTTVHPIALKHAGTAGNRAYIYRMVNGDFQIGITNSSDVETYLTVNSVFSVDTNYYSVARWNGSIIQGFIDGSEIGTPVAHTGTMAAVSQPVQLAKYFTSNCLNGDLGELRISNATRSDNWISTTYNNLNNPTASGTDPFYLNRYDDSQTYRAKSNSSGAESTFLRRTPIVRNHTGALTEYQQMFTIPSHALMNPDYSCVRFNTQADGNGTYLDYWIESKTDGVTADIWVKSDYASGDNIIYMFYGNSSLASESSISNTMIFGDEFNTDGGSWVDTANCTLSMNGELTATWDAFGSNEYSNGALHTQAMPARDYIIEYKSKTSGTAAQQWHGVGDQISIIGAGTDRVNHGYYTNRRFYALSKKDGTGYEFTTSGSPLFTDDVYSRQTIHYIPSTPKIEWFVNDASITSTTDSSKIPTTAMTMYPVLSANRSAAQSVTMDWFIVREYTATEPTYTIGITEAPERFSAVSDSSGNVSIFRKAKPIHIKHEGALTDQQVTTTIIHEADMLYNFDDIRFVTLSGEHVPYWIESKTDGSTAKVWFKSDFGDGDTYVWMYYGNEGLSAGSSGADTFIQYRGITTTNFLEPLDIAIPFVYEGRGKETYSGSEQLYFGVSNTADAGAAGNDAATIIPYTTSSVAAVRNEGTQSVGATRGDWVQDTYYSCKIEAISSSLFRMYCGDGSSDDLTTNIPDENMGLVFYILTGTGEHLWSFIRKYTAVEPIVTVGAEQHPRTGHVIIG